MDFYGAPYPIINNPKGLLHTQKGVDQIKSDLLVLLLTNPGERCFLSDFGTPLRRLVFEQNDIILEEQARQMIINSIRKWEPRVVISAITVSADVEDSDLNTSDDLNNKEHILMIKIMFFDPENINELQELRLELPISGG